MKEFENHTNIAPEQFYVKPSKSLSFSFDKNVTVFYIIRNGRVHITNIKGPKSFKTIEMQIEYIEILEENIGHDDLQINTPLPTDKWNTLCQK